MSSRSRAILQLALSNMHDNGESDTDNLKTITKDYEFSTSSLNIKNNNNNIQACATVCNDVLLKELDLEDIPMDFIGVNIVEPPNIAESIELTPINVGNNSIVSCTDNISQINSSHFVQSDLQIIPQHSQDIIKESNSISNTELPNLDLTYIPNKCETQNEATTNCSDHAITQVDTDSDKGDTDNEEIQDDTNIDISDDNEVNRFDQSVRKRKLTAEPDEWKRIKNKNLRMRGQRYTGFKYNSESKKSTQDQLRHERKLKPRCNSNYCLKAKTRQCSEIPEEFRKKVFEEFWSKMTWDQRKVYVSSNVRKQVTKVKTTEAEESRRIGSFLYFIDNGQKKIQVCRSMFLNTFDLGYKMIQHWVNSSTCGGMHEGTEVKLSAKQKVEKETKDRYRYLDEFLNILPKLPSHYARKDSSKLFLEPVFQTLTDVYKLYKEKCAADNKSPYSIKIFNQVFQQKNLAIYQLKKDQCNTCSSHKVGTISEELWAAHNKRKELARTEKNNDKQLSDENKIIALTMDLQAVKLSPCVNANAFYYKTKLSSHNFTVFNLKTHHVACYWFSEDQNAELKASTFVSCIIDYLQKNCLTENKIPIVLWSDGCTYQNRNSVLANALLNFSMINGIVIYQKFLEVGHTQMECDSVHALIERKLRNKEIYLPSEYVRISKEARQKMPYDCYDLQYNFFKNYAAPEHQRYNSIRPGRKSADPVVTDIKSIAYKPEGVIQVRNVKSSHRIRYVLTYILLGEARF